MNKFIMFLSGLIGFLVLMFGVIIPYLVSYKNDFLVIVGFVLIPITIILIGKIIKVYINQFKKEKNEKN